MHDAYISRRSENNRKNRTTPYILPRHWLYEWLSQFHSCGTYSVFSQSHSNEGTYKTWKCETAKVTGYKMRKYTWNYFCSLFTCTAVSAKSDCRDTDWQAVVWPWRASISRIIGLLLALMSQSRPLFKPTYEDERLPYTTLNNIALLLCLLYIAAPMNDRCTRIFNIAYRPTCG